VGLDGNFHIVQASYYNLTFTVNPKILGYRTYTVNVLNLTTGLVLQTLTAYPCHTATVNFSGSLAANTVLTIRIYGVNSAKVEGTITADVAYAAAIAQLAADTIFDESVRKINYIIQKPPDRPYPAPPLPPQYPDPPAIVPWTSIVIPWAPFPPIQSSVVTEETENTEEVTPQSSNADEIKKVTDEIDTPPVKDVDVLEAYPNRNYYLKHQSVPYSIYFYLGLDAATIPSDSPYLTIFLKNFQDRGQRNHLKKVYMTALTGYVVGYYEPAIDDMLNTIYNDITVLHKPVVSAFKATLIQFFLRMHVGIDTYPPYVVEYFQRFTDIIGYGDPNRPGRDADYLYGNSNVEAVKAYFAQRYVAIRQAEDKTTLLYWWGIAGLPLPSLVIEGVHNMVAFLQYANTFYRMVADKIWHDEGLARYGLPPFLPVTPPPFWYPVAPIPLFVPAAAPVPDRYHGVGPIDFFSKMKTATTPTEQLRVAYTIFEKLAPNNNAFSTEQNDPNVPLNPPVQARHIWQEIMIFNQPVFATLKTFEYFLYDETKYNNFGNDGLIQPTPPLFDQRPPGDNFNPDDFFTMSPTDNDPAHDDGTVLVLNADLTRPVDSIPVLPTAVYMPKGVAYRRCAGEYLNYLFAIKMAKKFADLKWKVAPLAIQPPITEYVTLAPYTAVLDNIFVDE
jgi:hypothetical protein